MEVIVFPAKSAAVRVVTDAVTLTVALPAVWDVGFTVNCVLSSSVSTNGLITKLPWISLTLFATAAANALPSCLAFLSTIVPDSILPIW